MRAQCKIIVGNGLRCTIPHWRGKAAISPVDMSLATQKYPGASHYCDNQLAIANRVATSFPADHVYMRLHAEYTSILYHNSKYIQCKSQIGVILCD